MKDGGQNEYTTKVKWPGTEDRGDLLAQLDLNGGVSFVFL